MTIKDTIRNGVNRVAESLEVFRKDVFELEGVPAFREYYQLYIFTWQAVYKGFYKAWHTVPRKTVNDPKGKTRRMATMNAGKMACSQMARYVWNERCKITASMSGRKADDKTPDPLNAFLQKVLKDNNFWISFGDIAEKAFALGGAALKEWVEIPKDENGNDRGPGKIRISYHMAGQFVPTAWDNAKVKSGLFVSREAKDGYYYSTVEWHQFDGESYRITNELYRLPQRDASEPQNILGWWYPLNLIYPLLSPSTDIEGPKRTFFQYLRPFGANYADDNSPLGMSIYAPAMDTLHTLDIVFDSFQREYTLGKKRIIAPARAMRKVPAVNGGSGLMVSYFDADDEVYQALATDTAEDLKIIDNSVDLRVEEHVSGINANLAILCAQVGFDPGTLSFDAVRGLKTATEVISEDSKTFGTVQANENGFRDELVEMVDAIFDLAVRYELKFEGVKVAELLRGGYSVAVTFDDSIIQDRAADIDEGIKLVGAGLMSKYKFMVDTLGYTPEEAAEEIKRIAEEKRVDSSVLDTVLLSTSE